LPESDRRKCLALTSGHQCKFPRKVIGVAHSTPSTRFFGARGHGASAFAHPTLAGARRSDGAILPPLGSLPSPPYEEAEVVLPPSRLLKNVFAVIDRADTLYCRVDCSR
jgi:hypothetical protein